MDSYRDAYRAAGYAANGQLTHRPRHQVPTDLRLRFNAPSDDISILGWDTSVKTQVYARLISSDLLAGLAGCPSRAGYIVFWRLLDPMALPEFRDMVVDMYPHVPQYLEALKAVRALCTVSTVFATSSVKVHNLVQSHASMRHFETCFQYLDC